MSDAEEAMAKTSTVFNKAGMAGTSSSGAAFLGEGGGRGGGAGGARPKAKKKGRGKAR